jgi:hypothetical protein
MRFIRFIKLWPEVWSIPLGLVAWLVSPMILHWIDPTAATFDSGVLQQILFASIGIVVVNGLAWAGLRFNLGGLFNWYANESTEEFKKLSTWQKHLLVFCYYAVFFLGIVLLIRF